MLKTLRGMPLLQISPGGMQHLRLLQPQGEF
jgi:hypothetical protein